MFDIKNIKSPKFLLELSTDELIVLAKEIREFIINNVSENGGHLSSNLGTVELIISMHYVFDSPHDKLIFDIGHQAYTHKILTGRAESFNLLRKQNGISGFLKYNENEHDVWESGHSSTSIACAYGFLEAKKDIKGIGEVVVLIGDGAIQNGLSLSSLNLLATKKNQKAIIILNDNDMSISKNVGGLSKIFSKIRIRRSYNVIKKITPNFCKKMFMPFKRAIKSFVYGDYLFTTGLGYKYYGPIDGHNFKDLIKYLNYAKKAKQSVILHVKTKKGKGYKPAEEDQIGLWHGVGPFNIETGECHNSSDLSWSNYVGKCLYNVAQNNKLIKVISAGMIYGTGLYDFSKQLPDQIIDVGISEESAVVIASSLARNGFIPFVCIYSTFIQRAYDEINHDVTRSNTHVVFMIDRANIVPNDGDTHQGIFDVSILSPLPNMIICEPSNDFEMKYLIDIATSINYPIAIRYSKTNLNMVNSEYIINPFKWIKIKDSDKIVVTYGNNVNNFKDLINKNNYQIGLINALFIKPLDTEMIKSFEGKEIFVYENVIENGSLFSMICMYKEENNLNFTIKGYNFKNYPENGSIEEIKLKNNLNIENILNEIK